MSCDSFFFNEQLGTYLKHLNRIGKKKKNLILKLTNLENILMNLACHVSKSPNKPTSYHSKITKCNFLFSTFKQ